MTATNTLQHGYCLCRTIEFTISDKPLRSFFCYCRDCQRSAGGPCQAVAAFNADDVSLIDKRQSLVESQEHSFAPFNSVLSNSPSLSTYTIPGSETASGQSKPKVFCNVCGCTIATIPAKWGGKVVVMRPSLLERGLDAIPPTQEWFIKDRPKFVASCSGTETFDTIPDGAG